MVDSMPPSQPFDLPMLPKTYDMSLDEMRTVTSDDVALWERATSSLSLVREGWEVIWKLYRLVVCDRVSHNSATEELGKLAKFVREKSPMGGPL